MIKKLYGTQDTIHFPIKKAGLSDFAGSADWTPASGDVLISIDGGDFSGTTNLPSAIGGAGSKGWILTLTAAELTGKQIMVQIVDQGTKVVDDQCILIETFGHASAQENELLKWWQTTTNAQLSAVPSDTPTPQQVLLVLWHSMKFKITVDNTNKLIKYHNSAGTVIYQQSFADAGGSYTRESLANP